MFATRRSSRRFLPTLDGLPTRIAPTGGDTLPYDPGAVSSTPPPPPVFSPMDPVSLNVCPLQQTTCGQ